MRAVRSFVVAVLAFVVFAVPSVALADGRVALVVGNSTYAHIGRLPNPDNDAADISAALRRLGFEVTTELDADRVELADALRRFTRRSAGVNAADFLLPAGHPLPPPDQEATTMSVCPTARRALAFCLVVNAGFLDPGPLRAQSSTPEQTGLRIAEDARAREEGFLDFTARQVMVLRNRQGRESRRQLRVQVLEVAGDGNKSLFVFDEPRDVQGTAFLVHAHREGSDDQWLYLPALRRVKRISSANRSGSFMGSEFAYEDLTPAEVERFTYRYLRDEPCGALTCSVTERVPVDRRSNYSRHLVWRDRDELRVHKIEYYDRKGAHLKTLTVSGYNQYLDRYWRAAGMTMVNHLTGKSTVVAWSDFRFGTDLQDSDFSQTSLRRAR